MSEREKCKCATDDIQIQPCGAAHTRFLC